MVHPEKPRGLLGRKENMDPIIQRSLDNGLSKVLSLVLEELTLFYDRDVNGVGVLYSLLRAPWLQALLKVHECLHQYTKKRPVPVVPKARSLTHEVIDLLRDYPQSGEMRELKRLLRTPHFKAFLHAHDAVAQKDFEPTLPPLPDNIADTEEAMRIVCLVKNKQPLGATIKRNEITGEILVARVINGGLADRSGLLYAGDKLVEVNSIPVEGLDPEHVIQILTESHGTIMFKVVPVSDRPVNNQTMLHVRAMADYSPQQDPAIPCADAGLPFRKGDILQIVDQNDALWWQARKISDFSICAGLIPSNHLLKRKQREFWWSQPFQPHTCLKSPILTTVEEEEDMRIDEKCAEADEEAFESEELREEDEEFSEYAGFRRSFRLCRRISHSSQNFCYSRCPSSCYSSGAAPYEEVVRYQRRPTDRHRLIVLVGPSGVGVNELRKRLIGINPNTFQSAVPHTTRPQKTYENNGYEYHFVAREVFESMVYSHRFLEYGEYKRNLYGTSVDSVRAVLDDGKVCIVDLDPQAIQGIRNHEVKPYVIFIRPPSVGCMRQTRQNARIITDYFVNMKYKEEDFQEIEETAKKMEAQYCQYFDRVIVNDNLQAACVQLLSVIRSAQEDPQWVPASWICSNT